MSALDVRVRTKAGWDTGCLYPNAVQAYGPYYKIIYYYVSMEAYTMANIKSAKKRIRVTEKKTLRNQMVDSKVKTLTKKVLAAVEANDAEAAKAALKPAIAEIDKAATKGILKRTTASRKISRLTRKVNKLA